ncbi:MAG: fused Zn-dependent amidase/peptidase/peptodoglycan-binding protein [Firmicutes bacterium]|nr:fused Zn-dependent amidase/peptidase/peptodoglycan-binding protein [Bacillota bacterium]
MKRIANLLLAAVFILTVSIYSGLSVNETAPASAEPSSEYVSLAATVTLRYGSTGESVRALQQQLNSFGYSLTADGIFGSITLSAVKSFQASKGLAADGIVGPLTWGALGSGTSSQSGTTSGTSPEDTVLRYGDRGYAVQVLQQKLNVFKYNLSVDGVFGSGTSFAVRDFQRVVGLGADGVVGPLTWNALDNTPAVSPYIYDPAQRYQSRVNSSNCPSSTKYYIYVNRERHVVCILTGSNYNWTIQKIFKCTVGAPATPTITGKYSVKAKGSYFVTENGLICKYYTQIYGDYLFHSILYYPGGGIADSRLGMDLSHGCIRLATENALYIYNNIPYGTGIWIE